MASQGFCFHQMNMLVRASMKDYFGAKAPQHALQAVAKSQVGYDGGHLAGVPQARKRIVQSVLIII